ncbi:unnamed protein product [Calypogeia fissa]
MEALQSSYAQFRKAKVAEYGLPPPPTPLQGESLEKAVEQKLGALPGKAITLTEIQRDKLTRIAEANWSVGRNVGAKPVFNAGLVEEIYQSELTVEKGNKTVPLQRVMVLEISQYLENYLWPNFDPDTASFAHVMSIILMVNEKVGHLKEAANKAHNAELKLILEVPPQFLVAETLPQEVLDKMHAPPKDPEVPIIDVHQLPEADGYLFGFPTRYGCMAVQFKAFFDATGQLWMQQGLAGKTCGFFFNLSLSAGQGGGQETTL